VTHSYGLGRVKASGALQARVDRIVRLDPKKEHLLRRAGFGVGPVEETAFDDMPYTSVVDALVDYEATRDEVDGWVGNASFVTVKPTTTAAFSPSAVIGDAQQRWLFRMVHSTRPLQEKMALFWHNLFATSYTKIAGVYGTTEATRMMAAKASEDPGGARGQIELFRETALGNFRDLLVAVAKNAAMLVWLDGRTNTKAKPQENFGRELMELFTVGVGNYTEPDVYAAARVFTGWNLQRIGATTDPAGRYDFIYNASQHDTASKTFSFAVYADGSKTIPARAAADGLQDGLDLIDGLARHPATARRLARLLYAYFVNDAEDPDASFVEQLAAVYLANGFQLKPVLRALLNSSTFADQHNRFARFAWPVEFVARAIKEAGWVGYALSDALTPLTQMGQTLLQPPDVSGWNTGREWFASGPMLARMNFGAALAKTQRAALVEAATAAGGTASPAALVRYMMRRFTGLAYETRDNDRLIAYAQSGWSTTASQLQVKAGGLAHLVLGSGEYQFL
jgi:uncharacterized protein (DUF1800 family)